VEKTNKHLSNHCKTEEVLAQVKRHCIQQSEAILLYPVMLSIRLHTLHGSAALGAQKEERNTRPIANPSQLKSFQHKVEVIESTINKLLIYVSIGVHKEIYSYWSFK